MKFSVLALFVLVSISSFSQIISVSDGAWNSALTWNCSCIPNSASGTISIVNQVTIPSGYSVSIDQTTIQVSGSLTVQSGGTLTLRNVNPALTVDGFLRADEGSILTVTSGLNLIINSGGRYIHNFTTTQGIIPRATWGAASVLEVVGYTTVTGATSIANWGQNFGVVVWNCPNQTSVFSLNGLLTKAQSNFNILSTGTGILRFAGNQSPIINIAGNLLVQGNSKIEIGATASSPGSRVNVGGDFDFNPSPFHNSKLTIDGVASVSVNGDFNMNADNCTLYMTTAASNSTGSLSISGDFQLQAGTIKEGVNDLGSSTGNIIFTATPEGFHNFLNADTILNRINYRLLSANDTLRLIGESQLTGNLRSTLIIGGVLIVESNAAAGAIQTGTGIISNGGNIRTETRTYNTGSSIIYQGLGAQFIGNGQPTTTSVVINNASGVSLNNTSSSMVTLENLTIEQGTLTVSNNSLAVNNTNSLVDVKAGSINVTSPRTFTVRDLTLSGGNVSVLGTSSVTALTVNGNISASSGSITVTNASATATFNTFGNISLTGGNINLNSGSVDLSAIIRGDITGSGTISFTGTQNNLSILGSGTLSVPFPFNGSTTLENFTIDRPASTVQINQPVTISNNFTIRNGNVDAENSLTVIGDLNIRKTNTLSFENQSLELRNQFNNTLFGGLLSGNTASSLLLTGTGNVDTLFFTPAGSTLGKLVLNRPTTGTLVVLNSTLNITDSLILKDGIFRNATGLTMGAGSAILRNSNASMSGFAPSSGPYDLVYEGGSLVTGLEELGALNNVTINSSGTVTLNANLSMSGTLFINSGVFTSGARKIATGHIQNAGTFNAPSDTLRLSGNFANSGIYNHNAGTIRFTGNTSFSGATPVFFNVMLQTAAILNAPILFELKGGFLNNGQLNSGSGTLRFSGTQIQRLSGSSVSTFYNMDVTNAVSPVSVSIESNQNLRGTLSLGATSTFDADGSNDTAEFTVLSVGDNAGENGSIGPLATTAAVIGNVTVQRYFRPADDVDRFLSSPVTNAPVSQLQDDFAVTGNFTGTSYPCTGCKRNGASLNYYDETVQGVPLQVGYQRTPGPGSSNAEILVPGRGYDVWIWNGIAPTVMDVKGPINKGTVPFTVTHTISNPADTTVDGWNLLGNPYPSSISWGNATGWTRSNIDATVWVWDVVAGSWRSYNHQTQAGTLANGTIALGQAFWVYAYPGVASLSVNENAKTSASGAYYRERITAKLLRALIQKDEIFDDAFIILSKDGTKEFDQGLDALKLQTGIERISLSFSDQKGLSLGHYALNELDMEEEISISIAAANAGSYALSFDLSGSTEVFETYYLVDKQLHQSVPLNGTAYHFTIDENNLLLKGRFILTRNPEAHTVVDKAVDFYPNPVHEVLNVRINTAGPTEINILDNLGHVLQTIQIDNAEGKVEREIDMSAFPRGLYFMKVFVENKEVSIHKILKQ
jgi:hypothetical protein